MLPPDLITFFDHYRETLNQFDWFGIADLYTTPAVIANPNTSMVLGDEHLLRRHIQMQMDGYLESGFMRSEYDIKSYLLQGPQLAVVDLEWTLEKKNLPPQHLRSTYNLRRLGGAWRIWVATTYQESET